MTGSRFPRAARAPQAREMARLATQANLAQPS